eukprot:5502738-Ditylum_brightwellii.AAC.1
MEFVDNALPDIFTEFIPQSLLMEGYDHLHQPLLLGNKAVESYVKVLGMRFASEINTSHAYKTHLNKAAAQPQKQQIIQLDLELNSHREMFSNLINPE